MTLQYFFIFSKSSAMLAIPASLFQRPELFEKAFFLARYLCRKISKDEGGEGERDGTGGRRGDKDGRMETLNSSAK